jgi:hypothetical protein
MPALPRPFMRRPTPAQPAPKGPPERPLPARRPVPAVQNRPTPANAPAQPARKSLTDRLFPVKPGMVEPPWTRAISLIIIMTFVWEAIWFATYYFGSGPTAHNAQATWQATAAFFPFALAFSALGSIPGFFLMRSRIRRANQIAEAERQQRQAQARQRPADAPMSSRARRRHAAKRGNKR